MRTWSFVNQKGGSGKTTLLLHVAVAAMEAGLAVCVADLDPQRSAEKWAELRAHRLDNEDPVIVHGAPESLKAMIAAARASGTDLLLIDTPAVIDKTHAYVASGSNLIVVPTRSSLVDRDSLADTLEYLDALGALSRTVVVLNACGPDKADREAVQSVVRDFAVGRLGCEVEANAILARSLGRGFGATEADGRSKAGRMIGELYRELTAVDRKLARASERVR